MKIIISTKPVPPSVAEDHGPGIEEDGFHIEDDEEQGEDVVPDGERGAAVADGRDAALVRGEFLGIDMASLHQAGDAQDAQDEDEVQQAHRHDREIAVCIFRRQGLPLADASLT